MIVGQTLGYILITVVALGVTAFFFWLCFVKFKMSEKLWGLPFLPGFIVWMLIWGLSTIDLLVFNSDQSRENYMIFGSTTFESTDGQKVNLHRFGVYDTFILNNSEFSLAIETASYGLAFNFGPNCPDMIPPHRTFYTNNLPDYYFENEPPNSISVEKGTKFSVKDWLRFASEEEIKTCTTERNLIPVSPGK